MSTVRGSKQFVPIEKVPQILDTVTIPAVFRQISQREAGAFILLLGGVPQRFVNAKDLADAVISRANEKGWDAVGQETLRDLVESARTDLSAGRVAPEPVVAGAQAADITADVEGVLSVED